MELMDHCKKTLEDQIEILWRCYKEGGDLNYPFIRNHASAILQLTDEIIYFKADRSQGRCKSA